MRRKIPSNQQIEKDYNVLKSYKRVSDKFKKWARKLSLTVLDCPW